MTHDTDIDILKEDYILKQMIYVNSANHGYSEIALNHHLAIFGRNNAGKTASLAGTKLLLFPEVNFYKCEKKFKFEGKLGPYSMEQSYDFYFPDATSFIILEVENPEGIFCMILYKTNNFGYGRFFVPRRYDELRHLFWNIDSDDFSKTLSIKSISKYVKENAGIQETDPKEIAYLMYDSFKGDKRKKRFCVLPLKDARSESINAFKNIYQLAFDTGKTETETLPDAIATLLEMGRGRNEERLDANLLQLSEEHSKLVEKQDWLQSLVNARPLFNRIQSDFDVLKNNYSSYSTQYNSILYSLTHEKKEYSPNHKNIDSLYNALQNEISTLENSISDLQTSNTQSKTKIELYDEALNKDKNKLKDAKNFINTYHPLTLNKIIDSLNIQAHEAEQSLAEYQKENGIKHSSEQNIRELNQLKARLGQLNKLIDNSESSVLHQLNDKRSASILLSLNKNIASISSTLTSNDSSIIKAFTNLFGTDGANYLTFLDKTILDTSYLPYDIQSEINKWHEQKTDFETKISKLSNKIQKQQEALKHNSIDELIDDTKKELKETLKHIEMASSMGSLEIELSKKSTQINTLKEQLIRDDIKLNELKAQHSKKKSEASLLYSQLNELNNKKNIFNQIDSSLDKARLQCKPDASNQHDCEYTSISLEKANDILEAAYNCKEQITDLNVQLQKLIYKVRHPNIDPHKEYTSIYDYSQIIHIFDHSYSTLDYDFIQHSNEIRSHNQLVSNQLNELKEAKHFLSTFVNEINSELNNKHVSNLSEINLKLSLDKRFETLLATLEKHDIQDESLLDNDFYISLAQFVESYFNKKTRRLKMHDIIKSINYQYTLAETGETVSKSQSGGTTSTITAFVLSVLLKRVTPPYVSLHMPIIVDEVSTLDFENTDATIKQIADHGFSIFCATPSFSGFISQKVGRWIMIDRAKVNHPMVSKCHINILPKYVEGFGELHHET